MMVLDGEHCRFCGPAAPVAHDTDTGERNCARCGTVLSPIEEPHRDGEQNTPSPGGALGGYMGGSNGASRDAAGNTVTDAYGITRQRMWQFRTIARAGGPESVRRSEPMVQALADKLSLPGCVRIDAIGICDRACRLGMAKGRGAAAVAAAAVMLAARRAGLPRRASEIADAANVSRLERHYSEVCKALGTGPPPPRPDLYVARVVSDLGLPESVARCASDILNRARAAGFTAGKDPAVLSAAAVHAAAEAAGVRAHITDTARAARISIPAVAGCSRMLQNGGHGTMGRAVRRVGDSP